MVYGLSMVIMQVIYYQWEFQDPTDGGPVQGGAPKRDVCWFIIP